MDERVRTLLDRYRIASRSLSSASGERMATEAGQSVEFRDFRPYQPGDEPRAVDWRAYARTGRLFTRLYQAERASDLHVVLDTTPSMRLGGKRAFAGAVAAMLAHVARRDARARAHLLDGRAGPLGRGRRGGPGAAGAADAFLEAAPEMPGELSAHEALKGWALRLPYHGGAALALVVSDLLDEAPLGPALAAMRARGLDAAFVQVLSPEELRPEEGRLELRDLETGARLRVGPDEVRAYREELRAYLRRVRGAVLQAGYRHVLIEAPAGGAGIEREALGALVREGVLERR